METFYKIDNFLHHGFPVYYLLIEKEEKEDTKLIKATEFNDKYIYYQLSPMNEEYTLLGKFLGKGKINTRTPYHDLRL